MKRIILIFLLFASFAASAQYPPNYTRLNSRYSWLAGHFTSLALPAGTAPAFGSGQWPIAGSVYVDTVGVNKGLYVYYDGVWNLAGGGVVTNIYTADGILTGDRLLTGNNGLYSMTWDSMKLVNFNMWSTNPGDKGEFNLQNSLTSIGFSTDNLDRSAYAITDPSGAYLQAYDLSEGKENNVWVSKDSITFKTGTLNKLTIAPDTTRWRGVIRYDETKQVYKSSTTFPSIAEIRGTDNDVKFNVHYSNGSKHMTYNMYGTDVINSAWHWDYSPDRLVTPTRLLMGLRKNLFGFGDSIVFAFPRWTGGSEFNEELPTSGHTYYWTNTHNLRSYRNGAYRSVVMNSTGYGVDTVYLNGTADSLVFEIFGRRYPFAVGSGGGGMTNPMTTAGDIIVGGASGTPARLGLGSALQQLRVNAGATALEYFTPSAGSSAISALTAAAAGNTIDNTNYAQVWNWSTLPATTGLSLISASTLAGSNTQTLFNIGLSGANGTSSQTTHAATISNTHTGTGSINKALQVTASGGGTNYALVARSEATNIKIENAAGSQDIGTMGRGSGGELSMSANLTGLFLSTGGSAASGIRLITNNSAHPIDLMPNNSVVARLLPAGLRLVNLSTAAAADRDSVLVPVNGVITAMPSVETGGGNYTPTITNGANVGSSSNSSARYTRTGNIVTVTVAINVTATLAATSTTVDVSLPIASNLGAFTDLAGTVNESGSFTTACVGDATNDRATVTYTATGTISTRVTFQFMYTII